MTMIKDEQLKNLRTEAMKSLIGYTETTQEILNQRGPRSEAWLEASVDLMRTLSKEIVRNTNELMTYATDQLNESARLRSHLFPSPKAGFNNYMETK
jgi:hypothetical protein